MKNEWMDCVQVNSEWRDKLLLKRMENVTEENS